MLIEHEEGLFTLTYFRSSSLLIHATLSSPCTRTDLLSSRFLLYAHLSAFYLPHLRQGRNNDRGNPVPPIHRGIVEKRQKWNISFSRFNEYTPTRDGGVLKNLEDKSCSIFLLFFFFSFFSIILT